MIRHVSSWRSWRKRKEKKKFRSFGLEHGDTVDIFNYLRYLLNWLLDSFPRPPLINFVRDREEVAPVRINILLRAPQNRPTRPVLRSPRGQECRGTAITCMGPSREGCLDGTRETRREGSWEIYWEIGRPHRQAVSRVSWYAGFGSRGAGHGAQRAIGYLPWDAYTPTLRDILSFANDLM